MSVLVQRPQHTPGLIMINTRHMQKTPSPAHRRRGPQQCNQPRKSFFPPQSVPVQIATQPHLPATRNNIRKRQPSNEPSPPRKTQAQQQQLSPPTTPDPAKRRPRSLKCKPDDGGLPEWDSPPSAALKRSARRSIQAEADGDNLPSTWQQAALFPIPALDLSSTMATEQTRPLSGSHSTPASPVRLPSQPAIITRSPTVPSFTSSLKTRRPTAHTRAPSYPTFPMHREMDTFNTSGGSHALDALLNLSIRDSPIPVKPASVGSSPSIHARMAKHHKKNNATIFASASFQHAPEAMTLPKPSFRFGGSRESSDSSSSSDDGMVVDLTEEEGDHPSFTPAFLM